MKINYVYLENIRSYESKKVEFEEGITLLWGDIGSGKSTLLQSIEFALFGAGSEIKPKSLLRARKRRGIIEVGFDIDGKKVVIKRILERKDDKIENKENYISVNGLRELVPPTVLKYRVFKLLGYPLSILGKKEKFLPYRYTVYTPQEQMKEILLTSANERLNLLRAIFDVDRYQRIIENAKKVREQIKKEVAGMEGELKDVEMLKNELIEYKKNLMELEREMEYLENQRKRAAMLLKEYEAKAQKSIILEKEIALLKQEIENVKERMKNARKKYEEQKLRVNEIIVKLQEKFGTSSVEKIEDHIKEKNAMLKAKLKEKKEVLQKVEEEIKELEDHIKNARESERKMRSWVERKRILEEQLRKSNEEVKNIEMNLKDLNEKIALISKEVVKKKDVEECLMSKIKNAERLKNKLAAVESEIRIKQKSYENLASLDTCPVCKQKVSEEHKLHIYEEVRAFVESKEKEKAAIKNEIHSIEKEINEMQAKMKELELKSVELEVARKEYERIKKDIERKKDEIKRWQDEISQLQDKIIAIQSSPIDVGNEEKKVESLRNKKDVVYQEIVKIQHDLSDIEKYEEKVIMLKKEYERLNIAKEELIKAETDEKEAKKKEKIVEEKIKEYENLRSNKQKFEEQKRVYESIYGKIREIKGMKDEIEKRVESIKKLLDKKDKVAKKKKKYESVISFLENEFMPLIDIIEKRILSEINMKFNAYFVEWFEQLLEHTELSATIDENFTPSIEQEGGYSIDYEHLSGGEKTSIALAYRLALNKIMNHLIDTLKTKDLMILDEPTDGFSSEQIQNMREVLEKLGLKQIILVSHEEMVKDIADNIIKLKKINGTTQII